MATLLAAVAVGLGSLAQTVTGFGFSLVSAPFLLAAYRAPEGVRLNLLLSAGLNILLLQRERRAVDGRAALRLLGPALAVVVPAAYVVRRVARGPLTAVAGLVCLVGVATMARGRRIGALTGRSGTAAAGAIGGAMNVVAGMSGPPVVLFAVNAGWRPEQVRPTLQLYFLGLNVAALALLGRPHHFPVALAGGFAAGVVAGAGLARRPSDRAVRAGALLLAGAGSVLAVGRGLTS